MNPGDAPYVILTTKPGVFRTEAGEGAEIIETYDYTCGGRTRAVFSIAPVSDTHLTLPTTPYV